MHADYFDMIVNFPLYFVELYNKIILSSGITEIQILVESHFN
jgi:hypothetical protein